MPLKSLKIKGRLKRLVEGSFNRFVLVLNLMKIIYFSFLISCCLLLFSCKNENINSRIGIDSEEKISTDLVKNPKTGENSRDIKNNLPIIQLEEDVFDFGDIIQGESVAHHFRFKNIGGTELLISMAKGSCGCTVPNWPKNPIQPGESGTIEVVFNSSGKQGKQNKVITVITNAIPNTKVLTIKGNIIVSKKK